MAELLLYGSLVAIGVTGLVVTLGARISGLEKRVRDLEKRWSEREQAGRVLTGWPQRPGRRS